MTLLPTPGRQMGNKVTIGHFRVIGAGDQLFEPLEAGRQSVPARCQCVLAGLNARLSRARVNLRNENPPPTPHPSEGRGLKISRRYDSFAPHPR
ncbi:hypothetical protein GCM10009765_54400 [Fodinicola feengrottensis]|uniref:Uncharacterized protein n=1 Tax=Fodinicola feengrottensis TaxID=435914 RepID=A0ABP4U6F9_9ACTN